MAINIEIRVYHDTGDTSSNPAAAQAGCTATCQSYYSGTKTYTGGHPKPGESGGTTSVAYTNYQLTATPATGWYFKGWDVITRNYVTGGLDSQGNVRTDVEIQTERTYHSGTNPYPANTTATDYEFPGDLAEANPGYDWRRHTFKWEIIAVYAQFEQGTPPPPTYTVTTTVSPSGAGTTTGDGTYNSGASCTLTATPASGYSFVRWEKNGVQVSTSSSYTFTVSESATYTAIFESATPLVHIVVTTFKSAGRVTLNGVPGDDTPSAWTTASADIPVGDPVIITATPIDPNVHPFKAWYLNPSGWGDPEHTGTLVSGAGATYTFNASANATYFATFELGGTVVVSTTPSAAQPEAKVSINGQTNNTHEYSLDVPTGSTVTVSASERGGPQPFPYFTMYYFVGWVDNDPDSQTYGTTLSTDRVYTFQLAVKQGYSGPYSYANLLAQYAEFEQIETEVMPDAAMGSISAFPPPKDGEWFRVGSTVTFTATPSSHYRFVKWTEFYKTTGREFDYSTYNQITIEVGTQPRVVFRAYFEWDGTDLLVNSANLGSPVKLVYDDRSAGTGLLVADY